MNVQTIREEPLLTYYSVVNTDCSGCNLHCDNSIEIYADDLRRSIVGDIWETEDVDRCPNATQRWSVSFKVVYKDENGAALLYRNDDPDEPELELIWVDLAPAHNPCFKSNTEEPDDKPAKERIPRRPRGE